MRQQTTPSTQALTVAANGPSSAMFDVEHRRYKTIQITGTFVGCVTVEGTIDGTNWASVAGPVSAPCIVMLDHALRSIRLVGSAWVSGTASLHLSAFNTRSE